jgi:3-phenylpropionate/cinnamic acid dioxygenase small subunit
MITNLVVTNPKEGIVSSNFTVNLYDKRADRTHAFFGRYQHCLQETDGDWHIYSKTIWLLNDTIPTAIDFFSL